MSSTKVDHQGSPFGSGAVGEVGTPLSTALHCDALGGSSPKIEILGLGFKENNEENIPFRGINNINAMDTQPASHMVGALRRVQAPTSLGRQQGGGFD